MTYALVWWRRCLLDLGGGCVTGFFLAAKSKISIFIGGFSFQITLITAVFYGHCRYRWPINNFLFIIIIIFNVDFLRFVKGTQLFDRRTTSIWWFNCQLFTDLKTLQMINTCHLQLSSFIFWRIDNLSDGGKCFVWNLRVLSHTIIDLPSCITLCSWCLKFNELIWLELLRFYAHLPRWNILNPSIITRRLLLHKLNGR